MRELEKENERLKAILELIEDAKVSSENQLRATIQDLRAQLTEESNAKQECALRCNTLQQTLEQLELKVSSLSYNQDTVASEEYMVAEAAANCRFKKSETSMLVT